MLSCIKSTIFQYFCIMCNLNQIAINSFLASNPIYNLYATNQEISWKSAELTDFLRKGMS